MSISSVVRGLDEGRLVVAPGVDSGVGVVGGGVGHVVAGVVETLVSVRVVEHSGVSLSLSLSFWLSLSLSLGNVDSSDRVGQISATGSIPVGLVGSNGGGGGKSGLIAGVAEVGGVGGLVEAVVAIGAVEHSGVSLGLSSSEGSATDLSEE